MCVTLFYHNFNLFIHVLKVVQGVRAWYYSEVRIYSYDLYSCGYYRKI